MDLLLKEIVIEICQYLTTFDLVKLGQTSKGFHKLYENVVLMRKEKYKKLINSIIQNLLINAKTRYSRLRLKGNDKEFLVSNSLSTGFAIEERLSSKAYVLSNFISVAFIKYKYLNKKRLRNVLLYLLCNGFLYIDQDITDKVICNVIIKDAIKIEN